MDKKYKILVVLFVIYIAIASFALFLYKRTSEKYILLSPTDTFVVKDKMVESIPVNKIKNLKNIDIYENGNKINRYSVKITNKIQIQKAEIRITDFSTHDLIGLNYKPKMASFIRETLDEDDLKEVSQFLESQSVTGYDMLSIDEKITYDLDSDGQNEVLYSISNVFLEEEHDQVFSFIYMIQNNERKILYKSINARSNSFDMCTPFINNIIDLDNDQELEIVIGCSYYDQLGTTYNFMKNENSQFVSILK